jgi:hypothetical protein
MEKIIKDTTKKLKKTITKDEALFGVIKSVCKHDGGKDYSEGFGFFCLKCGKHI